MNKQHLLSILIPVGMMLLLSSCIGLNIRPDQKIYWDNEVTIDYDLPKKEAKDLTKRLESYINPQPVRHTLGMYLKIFSFKPDSSYKPKENVKYGYLRQEPVTYSDANLKRGKLILENLLDKEGYFNTQIKEDTVMLDDLRVTQRFLISHNTRFKIARVEYKCENEEVLRLIRDSFPSPYMRNNLPLSPTFSDQEKKRIRTLLKTKGYFLADWVKVVVQFDTLYSKDAAAFAAFYPDSYADTVQSEHEKIALVEIKIDHPAESDTLNKYYLDSIYIDVKDLYSKKKQKYVTDRVGNMVVTKPYPSFPTEIITENIYGEHGSIYTTKDIKNSQRKLNQYGYFQRTDNMDTVISGNSFKRNYELRLRQMKSLGGNVNLYQSSLGGGLQLNGNYTNKNIMHKGIKMEFSPTYSIDVTTPNDSVKFSFKNWKDMIIDRTIGASISFSKPKLLMAGVKIPKERNYFSETALALYVSNNNRTNTFNYMNYVASFGYRYKPSKNITYELNPLFANITYYLYESDEFKEQLQNNYFLRQTFSDNFILGEFIGFSFSQTDPARKTKKYVSVSLEEAGGLIQLAELAGLNLTNRSYSKYFKLDVNSSILYNRKKSVTGSRILIGTGFLRGDTKTLPFVKQYTIGGPYELRGFRIRSIGPGHFIDTTGDRYQNIYQTADIKLVWNNEYRFDISKSAYFSLEGAFFVDAGNIWTINYDEDKPGSQFEWKNIYKDIAISTGWGIRANIADFLLLRVDFGTRVKYPDFYNERDGWIENTEGLNFYNFYKKYTTGQIAVGYPF